VVTELGVVPVSWRNEAGRFSLETEIPSGTTTALYVPWSANAKVTLDGRQVAQTNVVGRCAVLEVGAGAQRVVIQNELMGSQR
jgi:hypothetical protein